jgi:hypothetical protein
MSSKAFTIDLEKNPIDKESGKLRLFFDLFWSWFSPYAKSLSGRY